MERRGFLAAVASTRITAAVSGDVRHATLPVLGRIVRYANERYGTDLYVENRTRPVEFVGRVDASGAEFERLLLDELGFEVNPVAARKYRERADGREYGKGSYRLLPDGSDGRSARKQLHVRVYDGDDAEAGGILVYAHWEYRWDTDPKKHYRGVEWDAALGVRMTRRLLAANGVGYATDPDLRPEVEGDDHTA